MKIQREITLLKTKEKFNTYIIKSIISNYRISLSNKNYFTLVLSGGKTPEELYPALSKKSEIDWEKVYIFQADDRFVKKDDSDNNSKMIYETLVKKNDIPDKNLFMINTSLNNIEKSADEYESRIKAFFKEHNTDIVFDHVLLGIGIDGHTASIFPGIKKKPERKDSLVDSVGISPVKPYVERITMTSALLGASHNTTYISYYKGKEKIINKLLEGKEVDLPIYTVLSEFGKTEYCILKQGGN